MNATSSERRLAENEVFFREHNKRIQKGVDELNRLGDETGEKPLTFDPNTPLHFFCECSDENCQQRVRLSLEKYNAIHEDRKAFVVVCGHEIEDFEKIVEKTADFCVVQKYKDPPKTANKLNQTDINNG